MPAYLPCLSSTITHSVDSDHRNAGSSAGGARRGRIGENPALSICLPRFSSESFVLVIERWPGLSMNK
jgi:hypothetical protein